LKLDLNFGDFHLLDIIANILLKSSTFIRNLNMHLYRNNINLKIDIPHSLSLPYIRNNESWTHDLINLLTISVLWTC